MSKKDLIKFEPIEMTREKLAQLVDARESFEIVGVRDITDMVHLLETAIEKKSLRCRVYTEYRSSVMGGMVIPTGVTQAAGLATLVGVGVHNLATFNPDYEIAKNKVTNSVTVKYKKK